MSVPIFAYVNLGHWKHLFTVIILENSLGTDHERSPIGAHLKVLNMELVTSAVGT
jgi:hypothetical protein